MFIPYGYGYGYGFDWSYLILVIVSLVLGFATQGYIRSTYATWSKVDLPGSQSGADVARAMLRASNVEVDGILSTPGELTDHYDPRDNTLHLSDGNLRGGSVASAAVACHETGHAVQTARGYLPGRIRTAIVPIVNFASSVWMIVFIIGAFMAMTGLMQLAIILFAFAVVFQIVTLPVEFDASHRAIAYIESAGYDQTTVRGAKKVLTAAALTYVAAALTSVLQLFYLLGQTQRRR